VIASRRDGLVGELRATIVDATNGDGGLPYYRARASRLEPTAWAALALENPDPPRHFLTSTQRRDGLLTDAMTPTPNFGFNALALVALGATAPSEVTTRIGAALVGHRGLRLPQAAEFRQDNSLQAWGWVDDTFSWVEPTALATIALQKSASRQTIPSAAARIAEAEALLLDRACVDGGWNYGNANVYGTNLRPYVPTTALALTALQRRRDHASVIRGLDHLRTFCFDERSGMALSLTCIALRVLDQDASGVETALAEAYAATGFFGNLHTAAMAAYALSSAQHDAVHFRF
jgi:hypothetical protein